MPKNDVTVPKATLITSKSQFQQSFANKIVRKKESLNLQMVAKFDLYWLLA